MTSLYRKFFFFFFKLLAWVCFIIFSLYIILSAVFYVLGENQFKGFQNIIFATPFVYIVPIVLIASLIAGLFKDFDED